MLMEISTSSSDSFASNEIILLKHCNKTIYGLSLLALVVLTGCEPTPAPQFRFNQVALLTVEEQELDDGEHYPAEYQIEIGSILTALYGTPDDPKFPFLLGDEDPAQALPPRGEAGDAFL